MPPTVAALFAVLIAAAPRPVGEVLANAVPRDAVLATLPAEELQDLALDALPPAPSTVVRETRYYGTVTIDHRAHLARRAPCKSCHDPGPVTKIVYTPKVAHDRCVGCHRDWAKGPVSCQGCHVQRPKPVEQVAAKEAPCPPETKAGPIPENLSAALSAFDARQATRGGIFGREPFHRWLEVGLAAGQGQGIAVRVASHQDFIVVTQSVERMMSADDARTVGMLGAGISLPAHSKFAVEAIGLAGFDAVDRPVLALLPAVGARTGIAWRPGYRFFNQVSASVTGVYDLSSRRALDREIGGMSVYGTISTGFRFSPR